MTVTDAAVLIAMTLPFIHSIITVMLHLLFHMILLSSISPIRQQERQPLLLTYGILVTELHLICRTRHTPTITPDTTPCAFTSQILQSTVHRTIATQLRCLCIFTFMHLL